MRFCFFRAGLFRRRTAEEDFARAGYPVVSNSKNHRMDPDVPLLIPEVNAAHLDAIPLQQKKRGYDTGFIVTNPNCSTAGLVLVLNVIDQRLAIGGGTDVALDGIGACFGAQGIGSFDISAIRRDHAVRFREFDRDGAPDSAASAGDESDWFIWLRQARRRWPWQRLPPRTSR